MAIAGILRNRLKSEDRDICALKKGDGSLALVSEFLEAVGAKKLQAGLDIMTENDQVLAADETYIVSPGIAVNSKEDPDERAFSIFFQLLMLVDGDVDLNDLNLYQDSFLGFLKDRASFRESSPAIKERISFFEKDLSLSMFNRYSEFLSIVGEQKLKVSHKVYSFLLESIRKDIEKITDNLRNSLPPEEASCIKKVSIGNVSHAVVPFALLGAEGEWIVNENFARCLWILKNEFELDTAPGKVSIESSFNGGENLEFNIYETIIYSFVINHVKRAGVLRQDGSGEWKTEMWARGDFGNKFGYINLLGFLFYKFFIAEMGEGSWGEDMKAYLAKHPEIWRKLRIQNRDLTPQAITDGIKTDLYKMKRFFEQTRCDTAPIHFERYPREKVVSYLEVFDFLCRNNQRPWSVEELGEAFGGALDEKGKIEHDAPVRRAVEFLEKAGIINAFEIAETGSGKKQYKYLRILDLMKLGKDPDVESKRYYMSVPLDGIAQTPKIRTLLAEYNKKAANIDEVKARVLDLMGENWARTFLGNLKRVVNEASVFKTDSGPKKILIGIETGWIPGGQKKPIGEIRAILRELDLGGIVEIVEGDPESIADVINARMQKENITPEKVIAMVSRKTLENNAFRRKMVFDGKREVYPFLVGIDPRNLDDDSYIRILEMLVMAVRRSFKILPIAEHPDIEVIINKDGTVIFIPSAEPLGEASRRYYDLQKKVLLSA